MSFSVRKLLAICSVGLAGRALQVSRSDQLEGCRPGWYEKVVPEGSMGGSWAHLTERADYDEEGPVIFGTVRSMICTGKDMLEHRGWLGWFTADVFKLVKVR
jgi:hypothetical protein